MSEPCYHDGGVTLYHGDCLDVLQSLPEASVDAVVTDPPYGLEFMGKEWDKFGRDTGNGYTEKPRMTAGRVGGYKNIQTPNHFEAGRPYQQWCQQWAAECLRLLKPGGHMLAFGGTRTYHRLACAIEDAGFEIRDSLHWIYGSGFPKSLDVSKAIDKAAGAQREVVGRSRGGSGLPPGHLNVSGGSLVGGKSPAGGYALTLAATEGAAHWEGWGTALKPAHEPIVLARKPLAGTVAQNVLEHGTGALNVDGCRVGPGGQLQWAQPRDMGYGGGTDSGPVEALRSDSGRWPPNVLLGPEAAEELDRQSGHLAGCGGPKRTDSGRTSMFGIGAAGETYEREGGGASRFFPVFRYQAKASSKERPRLPRKVMRLRADLSEQERAYVLAELRKAGLDVG